MIDRLLFSRSGGPRRLPFAGHALAFRRDPLRVWRDLAREHGGVAPMQLGPLRGYLVTDPEHIGDVLVRKAKHYSRRTRVYEAMAAFLGRGILTTEGEDWRIHRRIVQPAFHRRRLASFASAIVDLTRSDLASWSGEVDVSERMMRLTLQIVSEVLLGTETDGHAEDIGHAIDEAQRYTEHVMSQVVEIPAHLPTPRNRTFQRSVATLDRIAYDLIDRRQRGGERGDDAVSMLLDARYEDGSALSRTRIRNELLTLLAAGHETTSNALSWTLMRLSQHPDVARRVVEEVDRVIGERAPTFEDISQLTFTRWVFDETMRLHPPVWTTGRQAIEDHELGNTPIARGTIVILSPYVTHRRADLWDNPEGFDPDRWATLSERGALPPYTFYPFGGGRRKCVGEAFAYLEALLILACLAQAKRLELSDRTVVPSLQITMGFETGLWMRASDRVRPEAAE